MNHTGLPIIVIFKGAADYLACSLFQAKIWNPESQIILIGDEKTCYDFVDHVPLKDYLRGARAFVKVYTHMSSTVEYVERFCFERWFVLRDFLRAEGIERCVVMDGDVLVYADLTCTAEFYNQFDMTFSHPVVTAGFHYVNSVSALESLCRFMVHLYTDDSWRKQMREKWETHLRHCIPGGVCDMTALNRWRSRTEHRIGETCRIQNGVVFDTQLPDTEGWETAGEIKHVIWRDKQPYVKNLETGNLVRFAILHFQGSRKSLMPAYMTCRPLGYLTCCAWLKLLAQRRRARNHINQCKILIRRHAFGVLGVQE